MNEAPTSSGIERGTALYVYGIVPADTPVELFKGVNGVDASSRVELVREGELAAITTAVPLSEFGEAAIDSNLHDPRWLEEKVRAHDRVLGAGVGSATILPFRFGAIYRGEQQVHNLLRERPDFAETLARLRGTLELGVKAFLDAGTLRARLASGRGLDEEKPESGRGYMQRRQLERELDGEVQRLVADCVEDTYGRLMTAALDGRLNPLPQAELTSDDGELALNAAYLVRADESDAFRRRVAELEESYAGTIRFRISGPWPPYNFAEESAS
jgi:hypothetical protein